MWVYMGILCHAFKKNDEWIMAWIFFGMIIVCYIGLINLLCMGMLNVCCLAPLYPMGSNGCSNSSRWGEFSQSVRNKIVDFNSHCIDGTQYIQSQFLYKKQIMKYNSRWIWLQSISMYTILLRSGACTAVCNCKLQTMYGHRSVDFIMFW